MKSMLPNKPLKNVKILVVDDEDLLAWSIDTELKSLGAETLRTDSLRATLSQFTDFSPDLVILDLRLADGDGMELLRKWNKENKDMPVILITAHGAIDSAITALRYGAFDYLQKPFEMKNLLVSVKRAAELSLLRQKVSSFKGVEKLPSKIEIIGSHGTTKNLRKNLERIARSKADTVLVYGESGTGKELAARAIHYWSDRSTHPLVEINCASIPENLLESELFGHEKGAFTDAQEKKLGLFEITKKGTVFLDEIGELPLNLQAKLLRVLEYRKFRRLGGTRDLEFSARIVAATNKDLLYEAQQKRFRPDLYYRLDVLSIDLPTLRERTDDLPELVDYFLQMLSRDLGIKQPTVSRGCLAKLAQHTWPGNIRELKNVLQRALILHEPDQLSAEHIEIRTPPTKKITDNPALNPTGDHEHIFPLPSQGISLEEVEKGFLAQALDKTHNSRTKAAELLGISRHTLRYRMEKYGMDTTH